MAELVAMLDDTDSRVRCAALHALACDRRKGGVCHLDEEKVLPRARADAIENIIDMVQIERARVGTRDRILLATPEQRIFHRTL
jgi:hypothetical protein